MRSCAPWLSVLIFALAGCELFVYADRDKIPKGQGGSSTTSTAGGGGSGAGAPCVQVSDCPGADGDCRSRVCVGGVCGVKDTPDGIEVGTQVHGDCKKTVCDGAGSTRQADDDTDVFDDHAACTVDKCQSGAPVNVPSAAGTACTSGGKVCDGAGRCVGCTATSQCAAQQVCLSNLCAPATCANHLEDGGETAVDCGGASCPPCADGLACTKAADCWSGVCTQGHCSAPTCSDGVKNGGETDVDCGGICPGHCGYAQGCLADGDCRGGLCSGTVCLPTCSDGVKDGGETGVDCGGPACAPCSTGAGCAQDADCFHGVCKAGICLPATCVNGARDGSETDVDCGGGGCAACAPGKACQAGHDCASRVCTAGHCATASCSDLTRNGGETGVDCGGGSCPACAPGQPCAGASDCQGALCVSGVCVAATCSDGVKDGSESDVDCGGPACAGCPGGGACAGGGDCASAVCTSGHCTTGSCTDGIKNDGESDVDCGGPCKACPLGGTCTGPKDCATLACTSGKCATPTCSDAMQNGTETDVDCGGGACGGCGVGKSCLAGTDCSSAGCFAGKCADKIVISQVRTNGPNPDYFGDDFVELYNPGSAPVTLDASWKLLHLSAQYCQMGDDVRFQGAGQVIPPHRYYLLYGLSYAGPTGDLLFLNTSVQTSIADAGSLRVVHGSQVVDALCFAYDAGTLDRLTAPCAGSAYVCEGTPVSNLPHNGTAGGSGSVDASLERKPGGAGGNGQDTGDSGADFQVIMPSNPRNSQSPAAP